jgi:succinyl-diaminopimelate desuccinylase
MTLARAPISSAAAAASSEGATLALAEALMARPSVTPADGGCQDLLIERLKPLGFVCETLMFGPDDFRVTNLWAVRRGAPGTKLLMFAGHTDVVPTGPLAQWHSDPFVPTHRNGKLYGRGAVDMKSSIAAFVVAVEEFLGAHGEQAGGIALLITSDEEGPSVDGTVKLCALLKERGERIDYCIVGEPTSVEQLGDVIKNGRRGSLSGKLSVIGVQGHIAYPQLAVNPIHMAAPALAELAATEWDRGNTYFPATSWQVSNIHGGTGATNVIPGELVIDFNFRFSTESTPESLKARVAEVLERHGVKHSIVWTLGGEPFITPVGELSEALTGAIRSETGVTTELSTTGGTSDGRFIAKICPQVVEFGPLNATIHKIDEHIDVATLEPLKNIYRKTLETLLT